MSEERKSRYELFLEEEARKAQPTKRCSRCKEVKALEDYRKDSSHKDGVASRCKACSSRRKYKTRESRFWKSFEKRTKKAGDCLEWTGAKVDGQPICLWDGKQSRVRRVVYELAIGELEDGMVVTPSCRNRLCVRQSHLKKITVKESYGLMWNNTTYGERKGSARLTEENIKVIRELHTSGMGAAQLARAFGVGATTVRHIITGRTWAHVE
jgi:hypothetical protein